MARRAIGYFLVAMTTGTQQPPRQRPGGAISRHAAVVRLKTLGWWVPVMVGLLYAILLVVHAHDVVSSIYGDSDVAAPGVFAELSRHLASGAHIDLGNQPYYEEFLILVATRGLPFHRELWVGLPFAISAFGLAMFFWTARQVLGGWSAAVAAAALICLGTLGRHIFFAWGFHAIAAVHAVILAAALVWITPRIATISAWRLATLTLCLGVVSALPVASDHLFDVSGLVPFAVAAGLIAWRAEGRGRWGVLGFACGTVAVAVLGGNAVDAVMRARHVFSFPITFWFVSADHIGHNIGLLLQGFAAIPGGDFFGRQITLTNLPVLILGLLAICALGLVIVNISSRMRSALGAPVTPVTGRLAYFSFWTTSLIATMLVYAGSTAAISVDTGRYLVCAYIAVAALLPAVVRGPRSRLALAAGISVFALASVYELQRRPAEATKGPSYTATAAVVRFARAHGIRVGYADYWDAFALMWRSKFRLRVYPVSRCLPLSPALCTHGISISSWYAPRPATPTMLIVDPANPGVAGADPRSGRPTATASVAGMTVYLYPYDISARLGLPRPRTASGR
jgi:hypothetical protein